MASHPLPATSEAAGTTYWRSRGRDCSRRRLVHYGRSLGGGLEGLGSELAPNHPPARSVVQSYTRIIPMADSLSNLMAPANLGLVSFGLVASTGVFGGLFLCATFSRTSRIE